MNKAKKINIPKILLVVILIGSLLGVHVMEVMAVAANEAIVEVSTYEELVAAIDAAQDGDVIGINAEVIVPKGATLGSIEKTVILQRSGTLGMFTFEWSADGESTVQNVDFDGAGISVRSAFLTIYHNTNFERVTFKNCITSDHGGAVNIQYGSINFVNCTFADNSATRGGHIGIFGSAKLIDCTLTGGYASIDGGAIFIRNDSACMIQNSTIKENTAEMFGGAICNWGTVISQNSKVFKNKATNGVDIYNKGDFDIETDITDLEIIFANEANIIVKGWLTELEDITNASFMKLNYEPIPTEVILAESSLGVADDSKITGLDSDKFYKVTTGEIVSYSKADGTLTLEESEAAKLAGTEIIGLSNGVTYKVEEYTPAPSPEPPGDNDNQDPDPTPTPEPEKPKPTPSPAPVPDKNDTTNNTTTNNDNSTVREDHSSTRNDYSGSNNTSTVHNYYTTEEAKASDESVVAVMAQPSPSPIYESVKSDIIPATPKTVEQEAKDDTDEVAASTPKNIRIEANGADVVFELNEDGYNISINANSNNQEVKADTPVTSSTNWYEVAKISLLAAIAFTLLWKPRKAIKNDLI